MAANFYAHRKRHHNTSKSSEDSTATTASEEDKVIESNRSITSGALSQHIQERLSDSGLVLDETPLSSFPDDTQKAIVIYNHTLSDGFNCAISSEQHPSGLLKEIIMAQLEDKVC